MSEITVEEWQAELARVRKCDEGETMIEIAELWNMPYRTTQATILRGIANGEYVKGYAMREDSMGRMQRVPVYRVAKPTKGSEA